jgi:hypothetical protein
MHADESTTILKRDVLGRFTVSRAQREALLDEFERSGLKGKPFARLVGLNYQTFAYWIQKRRRVRGDYSTEGIAKGLSSGGAKPLGPLRVIEAVATPGHGAFRGDPARCTEPLELILPGGAKLLVASSAQVALAAQLINSLRTSC